jgi:tetrahydromethanopterin S-methyltransferase subunit B
MENEKITIKQWLMKILGFNEPTASGSETEYLLSCAENAKNLRASIANFEKMPVIRNLKDLDEYLEQRIDALEEKIDTLEKKTIRLEKTFKLSGFYTAIIYVVFLIIGHLAHWL